MLGRLKAIFLSKAYFLLVKLSKLTCWQRQVGFGAWIPFCSLSPWYISLLHFPIPSWLKKYGSQDSNILDFNSFFVISLLQRTFWIVKWFLSPGTSPWKNWQRNILLWSKNISMYIYKKMQFGKIYQRIGIRRILIDKKCNLEKIYAHL